MNKKTTILFIIIFNSHVFVQSKNHSAPIKHVVELLKESTTYWRGSSDWKNTLMDNKSIKLKTVFAKKYHPAAHTTYTGALAYTLFLSHGTTNLLLGSSRTKVESASFEIDKSSEKDFVEIQATIKTTMVKKGYNESDIKHFKTLAEKDNKTQETNTTQNSTSIFTYLLYYNATNCSLEQTTIEDVIIKVPADELVAILDS